MNHKAAKPTAYIDKILTLCQEMTQHFEEDRFDDVLEKAKLRHTLLQSLFKFELGESLEEIQQMAEVIRSTDQQITRQSKQKQKVLVKSINLIDLGRKAQSLYQEVQNHSR